MAFKIGDAELPISVDLKPLTTGLSTANEKVRIAMTSMGDQVNIVNTRISGAGNKSKGVFGNMERLARNATNSIRDIGRGAVFAGGSLTVVGFAAKRMFDAVITGSAEFETQITNAAAVSGALGDAAAGAKLQLTDMALELSATVIPSATEVARVMVDLSQRGFDAVGLSAEQIRPILQLSTATLENQDTATQAVTSALKTYNLTMNDSGRVSDIFTKSAIATAGTLSFMNTAFGLVGPVAAQMGVSLEELTATFGFLADRGIRATTAGQSVRRMVINLTQPSKDLRDIMQSLGLTEEDLSIKSHGLIGVLDNLKQAGIEESQVFQIFDKVASSSALAILGLGDSSDRTLKSIRNLTSEVANSAGLTEEVANEQLETFAGKMTLMGNAVENTFIKIQQLAGPVIEPLIEKITEIVTATGKWIDANQEVVTQIATDVVDSITRVVDKVSDFVKNNKDLVISIVETAVKFSVFAAAAGPMLLVIGGLTVGLAGLLSAIVNFGTIVVAVVGAINPVSIAIAAVVAGVTFLATKFFDLENAASSFADFFLTIWTNISEAWSIFVEAIRGDIGFVSEDFEGWQQVVFNAGEIVKGVWNVLKDTFGIFIDGVKFGFDQMKEAMAGNQTLWEALVNTLGKIWNDLKERFGGAWDAMFDTLLQWGKDILTKIGEWKSSIPSKFNEIWPVILSTVKQTVRDIIAEFQAMATTLANIILPQWFIDLLQGAGGLAFQIGDFFSGGALTGGVPARQSGGFASGPTQINEKGGEIVALPNGSFVIPNDISQQMAAAGMGGGVTINVQNMSVRNEDDIRKLAKELQIQADITRRRRGL